MELTSVEQIKEIEKNEFEFWSFWTEKVKSGKNFYAISSEYFREWFFNRVFYLDCNLSMSGSEAVSFFGKSYGVSSFSVFDFCKQQGKRLLDVMHVFRDEGKNKEKKDEVGLMNEKVEDWSKVYLLSFYGNEEFVEKTVKSITKALSSGRVQLIGYRKNSKIVGVSAIYESESYIGMYCVGTLREYRRMGVASEMIYFARKYSDERGKDLVLQTLESDGLVEFYSSRGFKELYKKRIYSFVE